jgi:hypothetical protein
MLTRDLHIDAEDGWGSLWGERGIALFLRSQFLSNLAAKNNGTTYQKKKWSHSIPKEKSGSSAQCAPGSPSSTFRHQHNDSITQHPDTEKSSSKYRNDDLRHRHAFFSAHGGV